MHFSKTFSVQTKLLEAQKVDVEVDISNGLHSFRIVGLPSKSIAEARDRVSSAIKNSGFTSPKQKNQKVVVSLAPAHTPKDGVTFDLAIALSYLKASGQINFNSNSKIFLGELSLDGKMRYTKGILPAILFAKEKGFKEIFIPAANEIEASLISGINIYPAQNLNQIINHLLGEVKINKIINRKIRSTKQFNNQDILSEIKGNSVAKRGLLIAAAGGHNMCFYGPPGTGKTLLSKSLQTLLPDMSTKEMIVSSSIHSKLITTAPFRSPHHTSSYTSIIGGGSDLQHGEITMAHNGILFLDEFPEFDRRVIESLRQPMEDGKINLSRSSKSAKFPANFILVTSMNPCPCGYFGTNIKDCTCTPKSIENYRKKISGPIIDRIDMWIEVSKTDYKELSSSSLIKNIKSNETILFKELVNKTRKIQQERQKSVLNSKMSTSQIGYFCKIDKNTKKLLNEAAEKLCLSARSYHKTLKIARTIADINSEAKIKEPHILEALQYRNKRF